MQTEILFQAQRQLRRRLLDDRHTRVTGGAGDLAAHLLLYLDDTRLCWDLAVTWLRDVLDADRVDGGFSTPGNAVFVSSSESLRTSRRVPSSLGHEVDALDPSVCCVWSSPTVVPYADIEQDKRIPSVMRAKLLTAGTRSKLAVALRDGMQPVGLLCVDWMECGKTANASRCEYLGEIARLVLGPVLAAAQRAAQPLPLGESHTHIVASPDAILELLTPCELKVARLAVAGLAYKEIARQLNRSFYTVDHQLRSIRDKLGVSSTPKAIHVLAEKLLH
ncbi:helix-turn-helix transcriptional regulator [Ramlibacter sp. WS9]|uniref:helix-turn-helix transcriptional regulator n=1 Tax=Ramlibacter sp. WS9 TaxID=1882741 RepID=UPI0013052721|nr:helix-turn-helix transcriptional regulator [Ramlibacter sp. WS9]